MHGGWSSADMHVADFASDVHSQFRIHHNAAMVVGNAPDNNHTGTRQELQLKRNQREQKDGLASIERADGSMVG